MTLTLKMGGSFGVGLTANKYEATAAGGTLADAEKVDSKMVSLSASAPFASISQSFDTGKNWARTGSPTVGKGPTKFGAAVMLNTTETVYATPAFSWGLFKSTLPLPMQMILPH